MMDPLTIRSPHLTAEAFRAIQREIGCSDDQLAHNLGLSPKNGKTVVRRIKNDKLECSGPIGSAMLAFASGFRPCWWRDGATA